MLFILNIITLTMTACKIYTDRMRRDDFTNIPLYLSVAEYVENNSRKVVNHITKDCFSFFNIFPVLIKYKHGLFF